MSANWEELAEALRSFMEAHPELDIRSEAEVQRDLEGEREAFFEEISILTWDFKNDQAPVVLPTTGGYAVILRDGDNRMRFYHAVDKSVIEDPHLNGIHGGVSQRVPEYVVFVKDRLNPRGLSVIKEDPRKRYHADLSSNVHQFLECKTPLELIQAKEIMNKYLEPLRQAQQL